MGEEEEGRAGGATGAGWDGSLVDWLGLLCVEEGEVVVVIGTASGGTVDASHDDDEE